MYEQFGHYWNNHMSQIIPVVPEQLLIMPPFNLEKPFCSDYKLQSHLNIRHVFNILFLCKIKTF